jgi:hypothetical protein
MATVTKAIATILVVALVSTGSGARRPRTNNSNSSRPVAAAVN